MLAMWVSPPQETTVTQFILSPFRQTSQASVGLCLPKGVILDRMGTGFYSFVTSLTELSVSAHIFINLFWLPDIHCYAL